MTELRKRGPAPKPIEDRRIERLSVLLTAREAEDVRRAAGRNVQSVSEYIRETLANRLGKD